VAGRREGQVALVITHGRRERLGDQLRDLWRPASMSALQGRVDRCR
jgi:hypothetical protein